MSPLSNYQSLRVVVIGSESDEAPYRELVRRGVSDYVIGPVETLDVARPRLAGRPVEEEREAFLL